MRHLKKGRKLNRTSSHKKALMRNLATALVTHKRIRTTLAKAKELRPYIEKLITRAKKSYFKEQNNLLPEGVKIDVHSRRVASSYLFGKAAVQALFDEIAPKVIDRAGGYTRIVKTGIRTGDSASTAIIQLVDWYDIQDGAVSKKRRKKIAKPKTSKTATKVEQPTTSSVEELTSTKQLIEETKKEDISEATSIESAVSESALQTAPELTDDSPSIETTQEPQTVEQAETANPEEVQPSDDVEDVKVKKSEE